MDDSDRSGSTSSNHPRYNYQYSDDDGGNIKPINTQRAQKIESAMSNVWEVINKYGSASLPSLDRADIDEKGWKIDKGSPWSDVSAAMEEIVSAREAMHEALQKDADDEKNTDVSKGEEWWEPYLSTGPKRSNGAEVKHQESQQHESTLSAEEQKQFEQVHMEWATNAFAEELEALRNGTLEEQFGTKKKKVDVELDQNELSFVVAKQKSSNNNNNLREDIDVQVLADMIRSGGNMFSDVEKKMLVRARERGMQPGDGESSLPIHELRRRKLGCS